MVLAIYLVAVAAFLLFLNLRTYRQPAKRITYLLMCLAMIMSVVVAVVDQL